MDVITQFEETASRYGAREALRVGELVVDYAGLNAWADGIAADVSEVVKIPSGKGYAPRAGLLSGRGAPVIAAMLGCLKAGLIYTPLDASYPENRLDFMIRDSGVSVLLCDASSRMMAERLAARQDMPPAILDIREPLAPGQKAPMRSSRLHDASAPAYILYTSGSAGHPKGVAQSRGNVVYYSRVWRDSFQAGPGERMILLAALSHDAAVMDIFGALLNGAALLPFDIKTMSSPSELSEFLIQRHITIWHSAPTIFRYFVQTLTGAEAFPHLRYLILGGEAVRRRDIQLFNGFFPQSVLVNLYGQTESSVSAISFIRPGEKVEKPVIGVPPQGVRVFLADEQDEVVEGLGVGEIVVAGRHLALEYWNDREKTRRVFTEDAELGRLYWTGDLGGSLGEGRIEMLGRKDFQVKIRGYRVEAGEIESVLLAAPGVTEAVVMAKASADPEEEPYICAWLTSEREIPGAELRRFLLEQLPDYMIPAYFIRMEAMPRTVTGKLDRKGLPEPARVETAQRFVPPNTPLEVELAGIFSELLGLEQGAISADADFFQTGGHSLKAVTATLRIQGRLGVRVTLPEFFAWPSVRGLAGVIAGREREGGVRISLAERREYYPLTSAQRRLYLISRMEETGTAYNMPVAGILKGELDMERFRGVFRELLQRHESLRASFHWVGDGPVQAIRREAEAEIVQFELGEGEEAIRRAAAEFIRPFDLTTAPLLRIALGRISGHRRLMLMDIHHLISDGASNQILMGEFMALYKGAELRPMSLQYTDYAVWQNSREGREYAGRHEDYWLGRFAGGIPVLELPGDFPRPPVQDFSGDRFPFRLEAELAGALKRLGERYGATYYMVLLAVFYVLLHRLTGAVDMAAGSPSAGRTHEELLPLVGMFVNTLALRACPVGDKIFAAFLSEVREDCIQGFERQDYLFGDLVERLQPVRDAGRNPIFDVMFTLQNMDTQGAAIPAAHIAELELEPYAPPASIARVDLLLACAENADGGLECVFEYSTALFKRETAARFSVYFRELARGFSLAPEMALAGVEMIPEEELRRILWEFSGEGVQGQTEETLHGLLEGAVQRWPHRAALGDGETCLTYEFFNSRAEALALWLRGRGVGPGVVAAVRMERVPELYTLFFGVLKAGGVWLPVDPATPAERVRFILADSAAAVFLEAADIPVSVFPETARMFSEFRGDPWDPRDPWDPGDPRNPAYIIYTSGSMGVPKGVVVPHGNIAAFTRASVRVMGNGEGDIHVQLASPAFDAFMAEVLPVLATGGLLIPAGREAAADPDVLAALIRKQCITLLAGTPSLLALLNRRGPFPSLRGVISGGEVLHPGQIDQLVLTVPIYNNYGPTEATVAALVYRVEGGVAPDGVIPVGRPLDHCRVYVLDESGRPAPLGAPGEICIGGTAPALGYLNRPELTAMRFPRLAADANGLLRGGYLAEGVAAAEGVAVYRSGDRGRWLPGGEMAFLGRMDDQVKLRGFRIELGEIEARLRSLPGVGDAAVVVRRTGFGGLEGGVGEGDFLCAFICPLSSGLNGRGGWREWTEELRVRLAEGLPGYMVPQVFFPLERIPVTSSGKADRRGLAALDISAVFQGCGEECPADELEERLAGLIRELLALPAVSMGESFFTLGGHSLLAVRLSAAVRREFGVTLPVLEVFRTPGLRDIAAAIRRLRAGAPEAGQEGLGRNREDGYEVYNGGARGEAGGKALLSAPVLFCCPPALGLGAAFRFLAQELEGMSVCAFNFRLPVSRGEGGGEAADAEGITGYYLDQIRALQPEGPYWLAGASAGGEWALHLARGLEALGEVVSGVIVLDSFLPVRAGEGGGAPDRRARGESFRVYRERMGMLAREAGGGCLEREALVMMDEYRYYLDSCMGQATVGARVYLLAAEGRPEGTLGEWSAAAPGRFRVIQGAGLHMEMLDPPHAGANARLIRGIIANGR